MQFINNSFVHRVPEGEKVNFDCKRGTSAPDLTRVCTGGVINLPTCQERCRTWLINRGGMHSSVKGLWLPEISVKCPAHHVTYTDAIRCSNTGPEADIQCCPEHPQIPHGNLTVERPMNEHNRSVTIQARATCTRTTRLVGSEVITCRGSRWPTEMVSCQSGDFKRKQTLLWNVSLPHDARIQEDGGKVTFRARNLREARLTWIGPALSHPSALCYRGKIYWRFMVIRDGIVSDELEGRDEQDCLELLPDTKQSTSSKIEFHLLFHEFSINHTMKDAEQVGGIENEAAHCMVTKEELNSRFLVVPGRYERYKKVKWYNPTTYNYAFPLNMYVTFHCEDGTEQLLMSSSAHCDLEKIDLPLCGSVSDLTCQVSDQLLKRNNLLSLHKYQHTYVEHDLTYKIPEGDTVNFVCKAGSGTSNLTQTCTYGSIHLPTCEKDASEESGRRITFQANSLREAQLSWLGPNLSRPSVLCYTGKTYWQLKVLRKNVITEELEGRDEQGCLELLVDTSDSSSSKLKLHLLFHKFSFNYMIQGVI
uniref:Sushi domain-containing protein n=1 Tax=Eptatretus burgeri TaxID=7764 RepID=A0A8C4R6B5_EPTBU